MIKSIAVITPCFNAGKYIKDCIESVQASKTFGKFDLEHIIVDDGSTDDTWDVISKISFANVKKIRLNENKGPAFARNYAISQTTADYIFCLDADDVIFQNSLRCLLDGLLSGNYLWISGDFLQGNKDLAYSIGKDHYGWRFPTAEDMLSSMYSGEHFFQHNFLFSREFFFEVGGYDEKLLIEEEFDLCTRFLLKRILPAYINTPLFIRRIHGENLSLHHHNDIEFHRRDLKMLYQIKYKDDFKEKLSDRQIAKIETWLG